MINKHVYTKFLVSSFYLFITDKIILKTTKLTIYKITLKQDSKNIVNNLSSVSKT